MGFLWFSRKRVWDAYGFIGAYEYMDLEAFHIHQQKNYSHCNKTACSGKTLVNNPDTSTRFLCTSSFATSVIMHFLSFNSPGFDVQISS